MNKIATCLLLSTLLLYSRDCVIAQAFTMEMVTGYLFHSELTAAATGSRIAKAINERGKRDIRFKSIC